MAIDNKPTIKSQTATGAFLRYVAKTIPLAFDESMSYYECICALRDYINQFIDNLNNVNDGLEELQEFYLQLQDYVNNYFENLDVQEEINNKLDEMAEDGSLTQLIKNYVDPIYEAYETEINENINSYKTQLNGEMNNFKTQINNEVDAIQSEVTSLTSGSPLVASSTSDMTDTDRIYVNTTDGYWYYYDGDSWEQGGVYQSTGIGEETIYYDSLDDFLKNSINFEKMNKRFDYILKNKIFSSSSHHLVDAEGQQCIQLPTDTTWLLRIRRSILDNASRSIISFYSDGETTTEYLRCDIKPTIDNYSDATPIMLFNPYDKNKEYYYFYIPKNSDFPYCYVDTITSVYECEFDVYDFDLVNNEEYMCYLTKTSYTDYKFKNLGDKHFRVLGYPWWQGANHEVGSIIGGENPNNHQLYNYDSAFIPLGLGETVYIYSTAPYIATYDEKLGNFTKVPEVRKCIINGELSREFIATGSATAQLLIGVHDLGANSYPMIMSNTPLVNTNIYEINGNKLDNNIPIKNWITIGDSLTNKNFRCMTNYVDWCCKDLNIINKNYAVSSQGYKQGNDNFIAQLDNITSYNAKTDILTVMGSINDINHYMPNDLGQLGDTTTDTLYGAMYVFFDTLFTKFNTVRVGCISPLIYIASHNDPTNLDLYNKALEDTCKLFNVPFLNMSYIGNLRPWDSDMLTKYYTADGIGNSSEVDNQGVHPNSLGHQLFYARIREFIKSL